MTTSPRPVRGRSNLADEVSAYLREAILTGQLRAGQRIDQDAVADRLGLSRLPVREALIALDREGLVNTIPRRGTYVQALGPDDIADHYQIFGHVAGLAASRAAVAISAEDLASLAQLHEKMTATEDSAAQERLNFEFHRVINAAAGSARLSNLIKLLSQSLPSHFFEFVPGWHLEANEQHAQILAALTAGDPEAAHQAMQAHLTASAVHAVMALQQRGFFTTEAEQ